MAAYSGYGEEPVEQTQEKTGGLMSFVSLSIRTIMGSGAGQNKDNVNPSEVNQQRREGLIQNQSRIASNERESNDLETPSSEKLCLDQALKELEKMRKYNAESTLRIAELERRAHVAEASAQSKDGAIAQLMARVTSSSSRHDDVDVSGLLTKIDDFQTTGEELKRDVKAEEEQRYQATQEVIALRNELDSSQDQIEVLKSQYKDSLEKCEQLQEKLTEANKLLEVGPEDSDVPKDVDVNVLVSQLRRRVKMLEKESQQLQQIRDHMKAQSREIQLLKQQEEGIQTYSRKLESDKRGHQEDYKVLNEAFIATKQGYELKLESQNLEMIKLKLERDELQSQLEIARTEAMLYKEDFKSEREDREKAHHLKEEIRVACDAKVYAFEKERNAYEETIMRLTQRLEDVANEKVDLQQRTQAKWSQQDHQKYLEVVELEKQLFESQQRARSSEEDVLAKTAQVKQYKKKDDQREQMIAELIKEKRKLAEEIGDVQKKFEKTKQEYSKMFEDQKLLHHKAVELLRQELEKAKRSIDHLSKTKKLSKSEVHAELVMVREEKVSLLKDYKKLDEQLHKVQGQFARLMKTHRDLEQQRAAEHAQIPGVPKSTPSPDTKQSIPSLDSAQRAAENAQIPELESIPSIGTKRSITTLPYDQKKLECLLEACKGELLQTKDNLGLVRDQLRETEAKYQQKMDEAQKLTSTCAELEQKTYDFEFVVRGLKTNLQRQREENGRLQARLADGDELDSYIISQSLNLGECKGSGSYGSVYRIHLNGMHCIAKRIHDILLGQGREEDVSLEDKQAAYQKFRHECILLSRMRHPNIVQFMGVYYGPQRDYGRELTLIMECLHMSLEECLKQYSDIELWLKVSILLDVTRGLLHLHSQGIVHRDLTAPNILLTTSFHAKIADLGVSKIINVHPLAATKQSMIPGTHGYMPPEALAEIPVYSYRLDVFSFGVLMLFVLIQEYPQFYENVVTVTGLQRRETQIQKRMKWISRISPQDPMRHFICRCLQDEPQKRPTTAELNSQLIRFSQQHPKPYKDVLDMQHQIQLVTAHQLQQQSCYPSPQLPVTPQGHSVTPPRPLPRQRSHAPSHH